MTTTTNLPLTEDVARFMSQLYALDTTAAEKSGEITPHVRGTYSDSNGELHGIITLDLPCAAKLGAALTQIPAGAVEDSITAGTLPENISENVSEVLNILVNLFPNCRSKRLVLSDVQFDCGEAESTLATAAGESCTLSVDVQRYGSGLASFAVVPD